MNRGYAYDLSADQSFDFSESDALERSVEIDGSKFLWPDLSAPWDTALLGISIAARGKNPSLEARHHSLRVRQYFEAGAAGHRFFNLSGLRESPPQAGDVIQLKGERLSWTPETGRLLFFHTPLPPRPRVLVVAPHPDDAEIAALGLYQRCDTSIVTLTAGDHAGFYLARRARGMASPPAIGARLRTVDSLTVPWLAGIPPESCVNLGYFDGALRALYRAGDRPVEDPAAGRCFDAFRAMNRAPFAPPQSAVPTWKGLVADLTHILRSVDPEIVVTAHPTLDDHPDHAFGTLALCEALAASGCAGGRFFFVNHSPYSHLYPFGPTDGAIALPPHFGAPSFFRAVYSEPLSAEVRELKFLALEAMHDVRSLPDLDSPSWSRIFRDLAAEIRGKLNGDGRRTTSYLRRAVRPNELFRRTVRGPRDDSGGFPR